MSFNGSGTFVINSAGQPVVTGTVISSTAFNALTADLATGLSTTVTKNGQTTPTANLPMGGFKFTGMADGTAGTDSATVSQIQSAYGTFLTAAGTDTITATVSPVLTAYSAGQMFAFTAANTNTGAVTINISSLGAKSIVKNGNTALSAGDLTANYLFVVVYDGTQFQVVGVSATTFTNLTISGVLTLSGAGTQLVSTGTGAWQPPAGTTAQRPATPSPGAQRWNSTLLVYEIYNGLSWQSVASQTYLVNYLVIAGGGGGNIGGGGGAGGLLSSSASTVLTGNTAYTITIGSGGAANSSGVDSSFSTIATAIGGGAGGSYGTGGVNGTSGGSGGGGGGGSGGTGGTGGAGTSGQGFAGNSGGVNLTYFGAGGGGGGSSAIGSLGGTNNGGAGGAGTANSISGSSVTYAGGGGGGSAGSGSGGSGGAGGSGGGGTGGSSANGTAGSVNTGSGGGGAGVGGSSGGSGGSGKVVISYLASAQRGTGGTVTSYGTGAGLTWVHTFNSSGTYTA
jgi:hypothetical protein